VRNCGEARSEGFCRRAAAEARGRRWRDGVGSSDGRSRKVQSNTYRPANGPAGRGGGKRSTCL